MMKPFKMKQRINYLVKILVIFSCINYSALTFAQSTKPDEFTEAELSLLNSLEQVADDCIFQLIDSKTVCNYYHAELIFKHLLLKTIKLTHLGSNLLGTNNILNIEGDDKVYLKLLPNTALALWIFLLPKMARYKHIPRKHILKIFYLLYPIIYPTKLAIDIAKGVASPILFPDLKERRRYLEMAHLDNTKTNVALEIESLKYEQGDNNAYLKGLNKNIEGLNIKSGELSSQQGNVKGAKASDSKKNTPIRNQFAVKLEKGTYIESLAEMISPKLGIENNDSFKHLLKTGLNNPNKSFEKIMIFLIRNELNIEMANNKNAIKLLTNKLKKLSESKGLLWKIGENDTIRNNIKAVQKLDVEISFLRANLFKLYQFISSTVKWVALPLMGAYVLADGTLAIAFSPSDLNLLKDTLTEDVSNKLSLIECLNDKTKAPTEKDVCIQLYGEPSNI